MHHLLVPWRVGVSHKRGADLVHGPGLDIIQVFKICGDLGFKIDVDLHGAHTRLVEAFDLMTVLILDVLPVSRHHIVDKY
jgi:hypothetical protein